MTGCLTLLARLERDNAGNTLAIAAASLIPMMALIGGGVDISRAYMAKTQLQSACDAGVLAGRKAMSKSGLYGNTEKAKADSMFNFNFNGSALEIEKRNISYTTDDNDDGQVLGTATAEVPTLLMKIFGKDQVDLAVNCMAELQIGNADIMFVLDTTGSMGSAINWGEPTKIAGLRDAVRDFHKTIKQSVNDSRTRIRYGFVPYSSTVNVSGLITSGAMPTSYFADTTSYQTRVAVFDDPVYTGTPGNATTATETSTKISSPECDTWANASTSNSGTAPQQTTVTSYSFVSFSPTGTRQEQEWVKVCNKKGNNCSWEQQTTNVTIGTCKRKVTTTKTTYTTDYKFSGWSYKQDPVTTSSFKGLGSVSYASSVNSSAKSKTKTSYDPYALARAYDAGDVTGVSKSSSTWNGCIEERKTAEQETDFDPVPDDALDLDFDLKPDSSNENTRWKPMWTDIEYSRSGGSFSGSACPAPMMLLRTVSLADDTSDVNGVPSWLNSYVNNLNPEGNTYHDIGMIWGGRLTSPTGLFASNVNLDADKINVSKHIIFMTDGIMEPNTGVYSAYGIETYDHRIAPAGTSSEGLKSYHNPRFSAMCEAIKAQGTTIWVVAFGTSMTTELQNCASDGRSYYSSNTTALRNTFKYIAAQVADLRLGA